MSQLSEDAPDRVYVEFVRGLFGTVISSALMSMVFALGVCLVIAATPDPVIIVVGGAGIAASVVRLAAVGALKPEAFGEDFGPVRARTLERRFAIAYFAFAACLGLFGARAFVLPSAEVHMLATCLLFGYCAGVAAGVGLRPGIALPSMAIAVGPTIIVAASRLEPMYVGMSIITLVLLGAGCRSVLARYHHVTMEIGKRITYESLARSDALTQLPNRLALRESFDADFAPSADSAKFAVHYLDLDGFKPVNDRFGHPVGDALLVAVGRRIEGLLRDSDIAARLGGDEFAILQRGVQQPAEADLLVARLIQSLAQPYRLGGRDVQISTCVGTVIAHSRKTDLEQLLERADKALYVAKRRGRGSAERVVI